MLELVNINREIRNLRYVSKVFYFGEKINLFYMLIFKKGIIIKEKGGIEQWENFCLLF